MNAPTEAPRLYALVDAYVTALSRIDAETGEIDTETCAVLDALTPQLSDKIEACAAVVARFEAEAESCDALARQYHAKSVARGKEAERVRDYMLAQLQRAGIRKVKAATATVYLQPSTSVEVAIDASKLPERFQRHVPACVEADKRAIAAALDGGETIEGCKTVTTDSLRIR